MAVLKIALAQVNTTVGDLEGNRRIILERVREAASAGADLAVFPELCVPGYPPEGLLLKESFLADCEKTVRGIASKMPGGTAVLLGCPEKDGGGRLYNSCILLYNGGIKSIHRKINLSRDGAFDETLYFRKGSEAAAFTLKGVPLAVNIREDMLSGPVARRQAANGARLIINISASSFCRDGSLSTVRAVSRRAARLGLPLCYCNLVGGQDELVFEGGSFIADGGGNILAAANRFKEDFILMEFGKERIPPGKASPAAARAKSAGDAPGTGEVYEALVLGLRDYALKNGFKKAVLGISGGIDSAVSAALAVKALGTDNVTGVSMPSVYSSRLTLRETRKLAENLGITLLKIPIGGILDEFLGALMNEPHLPADTTEENLQARIRGTILMALSNKSGSLALSTGNKSEISCGYCTLYGDTAGGFCVLKDVYKTEVYELARFINSLSAPPPIPESTIDREPTAELKFGQKDRDSLPPYAELDAVLALYLEKGQSIPRISENTGFPPAAVRKVIAMVDSSEYKRRQSPPGVRITRGSARMPVTNRYPG